MSWASLHVQDVLIQRLTSEMGMPKPSRVQAASIGPIYEGRNCLVGSPTGTGKTLAFAVPMIGKLMVDPYGVFGIVLTPTRELAIQIKQQLVLLGGPSINVLCVIGGVDFRTQAQEINNKPHFIVATPGRLADHIDSNPDQFTNHFRYLKFLVLDEADRMLDGQFDDQLKNIRTVIPRENRLQILLFSATVTENLSETTGILMGKNKPFVYDASGREGEKTLTEKYILCPPDFKDGYLIELLRSIRDGDFGLSQTIRSMLLFCSTNKDCDVLKLLLDELGFKSAVLHSMMPQASRNGALAEFKSSRVPMLIATDIASRGLDILAVDLVINYTVPMPIDYIHRIGRAGRGCLKGFALTFVTPRDVKFIKNIENFTKTILSGYEIEESKVLLILKEVTASKKAAVLNVEENDVFRDRQISYKRKREML